MPDYIVAKDTDRDYPVTVVDPQTGNAFLLDDTYTLSGAVWLGDETNTLFAPTISLDRPTGNTDPTGNLLLRFTRSMTNSVSPGDYAFQAWATKAGVRQTLLGAYPATLRITPGGGTDTAPTSWISYDALLGWNPAIDTHLDAARDQSGFLQARGEATRQFKKMILDRAKLRPGFTLRRLTTFNPIHGYEVQDYATPPPSLAAISAAMEANRLRVDVTAREILARLTLAILLDSDMTTNARNNPFSEFLARSSARLDEMFESYKAPIDLDGNGADDVLIGVDATYLGDPT